MATETTLRPGEIKDILLKEIEAADLHELDVEEVGGQASLAPPRPGEGARFELTLPLRQ